MKAEGCFKSACVFSAEEKLNLTDFNLNHKVMYHLKKEEGGKKIKSTLNFVWMLKTRGNTEETNSCKNLCLMFVHVCFILYKFVSGLIFTILENLWFGDLCAE